MARKWFIVAVVVVLAGCQPRIEEPVAVVPAQECDYLLAVVVDMSGSYAAQMTSDGRAYKFLMHLVERFFRDRIGSNDRIIIAQVSGTEKALLWDGSPRALRQEFASAKAFADFLQSRSNPAGSRIHDGIAETLEYVMDFPSVASGKTKSAMFVLSDMDDNFPDSDSSKARLVQALSEYAKTGGVVGFYWVDHALVSGWRQSLKAAGLNTSVVESEISAQPPIPTFDN